jgi:phosphopantothenate---cysteine ligase (CTP)
LRQTEVISLTSSTRIKILITSGGTLEKWDEVRGHTNLARGTMGVHLAEAALKRGAEVIYLHGYFAQVPPSHPNLRTQSFMGIDDLSEQIQTLVTSEPIAAVVMTAAVSDWVIDKILDEAGNPLGEHGKLSSDTPPVIHFKKAPKVISSIKSWNPDLLLVGFKLEHNSDVDYLLNRAQMRMETWRADFVIANASSSLYTEETPHYLVTRSGDYNVYRNKKETASALLDTLTAELFEI